MSTHGRTVPASGAVRMRRVARIRRALALAGCGVLSVGLAACESTEQESSRIGRENEAAARAVRTAPGTAASGHRGARSHGRTHTKPGSARTPATNGANP